MTKLKTNRRNMVWVEVRHLKPHPEVQRELVASHVKRLQERFDPNAMDPICAIKDPNSKDDYLVFNGGHRVQAAHNLYGPNVALPTWVYTSLSDVEMARLSYESNTTRAAWRAVETFYLMLKQKDKNALRIKNKCDSLDLVIGPGREVSAVKALLWICTKFGPDMMDRTLDTAYAAWGKDRDAYTGTLLKALASVLNRYDGVISVPGLVNRLSKNGGPGTSIGKGRDFARAANVSVINGIANYLVNSYNTRRTKQRIESWS